VSQSDPLYRNRRRADSFGEDAERYDRVRPPYPGAMLEHVLVNAPRHVLDVGCGTGIASRLLAERGCDVLGLEPDSRMAVVARRRGVTVEDGTFEQWDPKGRQFDLLTAGQSWHWVDPNAGAAKAADVLRPRGRLALFWNQAFPEPPVQLAMAAVYSRHAPELGDTSVLIGKRESDPYRLIAAAAEETGRFDDIGQKF